MARKGTTLGGSAPSLSGSRVDGTGNRRDLNVLSCANEESSSRLPCGSFPSFINFVLRTFLIPGRVHRLHMMAPSIITVVSSAPTKPEKSVKRNTSGNCTLLAIRGYQCFRCHTHLPKLLRCSGCQLVHYCSKECQKLDWKKGHRGTCKALKAVNERDLRDEKQELT